MPKKTKKDPTKPSQQLVISKFVNPNHHSSRTNEFFNVTQPNISGTQLNPVKISRIYGNQVQAKRMGFYVNVR